MYDQKSCTSVINECDSNVNTYFLGTNFVSIDYTSFSVDVYPCNTFYKPLTNDPIVLGSTVWKNKVIDITYILILHK